MLIQYEVKVWDPVDFRWGYYQSFPTYERAVEFAAEMRARTHLQFYVFCVEY